jgi:hypothetical protein
MNWMRDMANLAFQVSNAIVNTQIEKFKGDYTKWKQEGRIYQGEPKFAGAGLSEEQANSRKI